MLAIVSENVAAFGAVVMALVWVSVDMSQRSAESADLGTEAKQGLECADVAIHADLECGLDTIVSENVKNVELDTCVSGCKSANLVETEETVVTCRPAVDAGLGSTIGTMDMRTGEPVSCTVSEPDTCVSGEQKISQVEIESVVVACHPVMGAGLGAAVGTRGTSGGDLVLVVVDGTAKHS